MGIWNRLGNVLKSYLNDGIDQLRGEDHDKQNTFRHRNADDDYNTAYEELEDFLRGGKAEARDTQKPGGQEFRKNTRPVPPELKADFAELGLSPEASEEECKETYKKLLKIHHPDRHGNDPELYKKATEKSARINAAYDRLVKWFKMNK